MQMEEIGQEGERAKEEGMVEEERMVVEEQVVEEEGKEIKGDKVE
jgi:hypothetical protein